jgi:pilus assembly protein Flp/PilA
MFTYCFALLERLKADRKGVTALEYGVIAAAIIVAIGAIMGTMGGNLKTMFTSVSGQI